MRPYPDSFTIETDDGIARTRKTVSVVVPAPPRLLLRFSVDCPIEPKGSKRIGRRGRGAGAVPCVIDDSRKYKHNPTQEAVARGARAAYRGAPSDGACMFSVRVRVLRPKSLPKRVTVPRSKPDFDKVLRAVLDGLTDGGVWTDDGRAARIAPEPQSGRFFDRVPGVDVVVWEIEP